MARVRPRRDPLGMFRFADIDAETELERHLLADPELRAGLAWGAPRFGHPEGTVRTHVAAMLAAIDPADPLRADLRVLALIHDSFKRATRPSEPWSPDNDHAVLARRFAERYVRDRRLLATIELHDEPYWLWRNAPDRDGALEQLVDGLPDLPLFARFVELDASTEGKDQTFLWWFRRRLAKLGRLPAHDESHDPGDEPAAGVPTLLVKTFATNYDDQAAVAAAVAALVGEHADRMRARGEVLVSEDGLRVMLVWRWRGSRTPRLIRDGDVIREALAAHPVLAEVDAVEARIYRPA